MDNIPIWIILEVLNLKSVLTILLMMVQARFSKFIRFWLITAWLSILTSLLGWKISQRISLGPISTLLVMFTISILSFFYGLNMRLADICEQTPEEVKEK